MQEFVAIRASICLGDGEHRVPGKPSPKILYTC